MFNNKYLKTLYFGAIFFLLLIIYFYNIHTKIKTHIDDELIVKVIKVVDVDTIYVTNQSNKTLKIKFANIRFPNKDLLGLNDSIKMIKDQLLNKIIKVQIIDKDKYNRFLAIIYLDGHDFNYYLVANGCAWHFKRYSRLHQNKLEYLTYQKAQQIAKQQKKCLWSYKIYNSPHIN